jgi:hypothetical protein
MSDYDKRMEIARRNVSTPVAAVVKQEYGNGAAAAASTDVYVSTPIKAYAVKEEPRTPTVEQVEDGILWAIAADVEDANEVAEAVACLRVDDVNIKRDFMNFLVADDDDEDDVIPPPKKQCFSRALTF